MKLHNRQVFFLLLLGVVVLALFFSQINVASSLSLLDKADTAWMIVASALVLLLMTPGLAFFYGGMVSKKNVISTMLQSFISLGVISLVWVFSDSVFHLEIV